MAGQDIRYLDELVARATALSALLIAGCVGGPLTAERVHAADARRSAQASHALAQDGPVSEPWLTDRGPVDPSIPAPASVIGHVIADGAVRYEAMVRYLQTLAEASPLVTLTPYTKSHEGRTLYYVTITSERNHARLPEIKAGNAKLADPRKLAGDQEAEQLLTSLPGVAWLAYSIHGDELSSTDAAVQLAYQLAAGADEATKRLRDELVIHIDPLQNPDGRERALGQLKHLTGKVPNPDHQAMQHAGLWSAGRGNHYLVNLNRDWLMQVHPETQGRAAQILAWNPHLVVDSHEMGSLDTYLFDPPGEPYNVNLSEANLKWRRHFSVDQAKAFDRHGWSYYTQDWYEEWYPGYTNAWANLLGAVGILYEQAAVDAASIRQPAGTTLTYPEAVYHQLTSSLANLETLRAQRREILEDYLEDRRWAVSQERSGPEVFLLPMPADRAALRRFVGLLGRHGIETAQAAGPFDAADVVDMWGQHFDTKAMPADTLLVRAAQPHRRLLRAILEFDPHMSDKSLLEERNDLENHRGTRVYDITAWNLCMAYGLEGYWAGRVGEITPKREKGAHAVLPGRSPGYGYLIDGASSDLYRAVGRLLDRECKLRVALKPFTVAGRTHEAGTVLLRAHENPEAIDTLVKDAAVDLEVDAVGVDTALCDDGPDLGSRRFRLLIQPRIAVASQWPIATTSFGSTWHLLDARLGLRVSPLSVRAIAWGDLRKYNVIVLPHTWSPSALGGVLDEGIRKKLRSWVGAGGTLIALGRSAAFLAGKDEALSSVRLRRDVLDELAVYKEAVRRERSARAIHIDPDAVWGTGETPPDGDMQEAPSDEKKPGRSEATAGLDALKRQDTWQRLFSPQGAFAAAVIDPEHWLCFGLPVSGPDHDRLPVMLSGGTVLMSKYPVRTPARLAEADDLRLSGLLWPEARERLANSAYATVERVGYGQIILFATDPFFRGYLEGTGRMFLNALLFGPGSGTSPPVPW